MGHMALLRRFQSLKTDALSVALNQTLKEDNAKAYDCEREMKGRLRDSCCELALKQDTLTIDTHAF